MESNTLSLKALFSKDIRYIIPTFQRPYVWDQEEQWEPLWDDVRNTAERYMDELDKLGEDRAAEDAAQQPNLREGQALSVDRGVEPNRESQIK